MKVKYLEKKGLDCYVGDIVLFNGIPHMVVCLGELKAGYGLLCLCDTDSIRAGVIVEPFDALHKIDLDTRVTELLIERRAVVISKEVEEEACQD